MKEFLFLKRGIKDMNWKKLKTMKRNEWFKHLILYGIGIFIIPLGAVLTVNAHLGAGGYDALNFAIADRMGLPVSYAVSFTAFIVLSVTAFMRRSYPRVETFVTSYLQGLSTDFWKEMVEGIQGTEFIDSLIKGYPVGTMLFYETYEDNKRTYILVDGLQRGNSIKKYMTNPTEFFYDDSISDEFCSSVLKLVHQSNEKELYAKIRGILTTFIKTQKTFKNLQYFSVAKQIADEFSAGFEPIEQLIEVIKLFFEERQDLYDRIASTIIPVIVYTGDENNLPEIFDRINSQGTPLDQYEVYAAAWPVKQKFALKNQYNN